MYKNEVQVYNEFAKITSTSLSYEDRNKKLEELNRVKQEYFSKGSTESKLKSVCDLLLDPKWFGHIHTSDLFWLPIKHRNLLNLLGPERLKANGYKEADLIRESKAINTIEDSRFRDEITSRFLIGERYTLKFIKEELRSIYLANGLTKSSKASDLLEYFCIKEVGIYDSITKKQSKGYEILSLKE